MLTYWIVLLGILLAAVGAGMLLAHARERRTATSAVKAGTSDRLRRVRAAARTKARRARALEAGDEGRGVKPINPWTAYPHASPLDLDANYDANHPYWGLYDRD